ncbi:unnamed protein product [Rhizophagus irregularis]|nr:unnamed protein product [Rhizophagus irregularis]
MNPARRNKIDLDKLTEEERKHFRMYGKLPAGKAGKDLISHKLKERKYFDSGDYALSKAGKTSGPVGVQHPSPETIPHSNAIAAVTHNSSPVKESSLVHETEIDEKSRYPICRRRQSNYLTFHIKPNNTSSGDPRTNTRFYSKFFYNFFNNNNQ